MTIKLPILPYDITSLSPFISSETLAYHYGKHHANYVNNTNNLIQNTPLEHKSLEEIILISASDSIFTSLFNNAAQCYNHEFYWKSLTPSPQKISKSLEELLIQNFGSLNDFQKNLYHMALNLFGSGWCWLVATSPTDLKIITTGNAQTPLTLPNSKPLLCIDVWEHAYYLDYQNKRADYLNAVIDNLLNWSFAEENLNPLRTS